MKQIYRSSAPPKKVALFILCKLNCLPGQNVSEQVERYKQEINLFYLLIVLQVKPNQSVSPTNLEGGVFTFYSVHIMVFFSSELDHSSNLEGGACSELMT